MLDLNYLWDFLGITTAKMESSEERFKVGLQSKCSKGDFWRGILALLGLVLCIPSTIFYIRGDKRSVTSFIELLLLSVGAFLLAFSILSTILSCIRMGQNRRKLENLIVDETRHDDVLICITECIMNVKANLNCLEDMKLRLHLLNILKITRFQG